MQILTDISLCPDTMRGGVVALGNFDGFHRGHQAVIGEAGRLARSLGCPLLVLTMDPHPRRYFAPESDRFALTPSLERAFLLEHFGVDGLVLLRFDAALAQTSAEEFVRKYLVEGLQARHVVVGYDFRFGKGRAGSVGVLKDLGARDGFETHALPAISSGVEGSAGEVYSSTLVREALKKGHARRAASLLGHWWAVEAIVETGDQKGRSIGFPTANLRLGEAMPPKYGVYAVRMENISSGKIYDGVANVGIRPTTSNPTERLEVHVFDFDEDIYGKVVRVEFVGFIRAERKFESFDALKEQITKDVLSAKLLLADPDNIRAHLTFPTLDEYLRQHPTSLI